MTIRIGVLGATGYTGLEALRLLVHHPEVQVTCVTSRQEEGRSIADVHPHLAGELDLALMQPDIDEIARLADVAMCCLPHGASAATVKQLREANVKVIDFSADFRLSCVDEYEQWYGVKHPWPEMVGKVAYGLPELFANQIQGASLVANPGCYPTSAIVPLAPLVSDGAIDSEDVIVDAKTGVSGAGRAPKLGTLFCEADESIAPYATGSHRHQPEIGDIINRSVGIKPSVLFSPHLAPMHRGILSTIYVRPRNGIDAEGVRDLWQQAYSDDPFVRIVNHVPATRFVSGTNYIDLYVTEAVGRLVVVAAIDNLLKGASGAAVQNLNCMFGWDQQAGFFG